MVFRGVHLGRVLIAAVAVAGLLFGLGSVYRWRTVDRPMADALEEHPAVLAVDMDAAGGSLVARVELAAVPNLRETYLELRHRLDEAGGGGQVKLELADRRTPQLVDDYYALHYYIMEAANRGTYPEMARAIEGESNLRGISHTGFFVDSERIYVQIHRDDDYLYEVIAVAGPAGAARHPGLNRGDEP